MKNSKKANPDLVLLTAFSLNNGLTLEEHDDGTVTVEKGIKSVLFNLKQRRFKASTGAVDDYFNIVPRAMQLFGINSLN